MDVENTKGLYPTMKISVTFTDTELKSVVVEAHSYSQHTLQALTHRS